MTRIKPTEAQFQKFWSILDEKRRRRHDEPDPVCSQLKLSVQATEGESQ